MLRIEHGREIHHTHLRLLRLGLENRGNGHLRRSRAVWHFVALDTCTMLDKP